MTEDRDILFKKDCQAILAALPGLMDDLIARRAPITTKLVIKREGNRTISDADVRTARNFFDQMVRGFTMAVESNRRLRTTMGLFYAKMVMADLLREGDRDGPNHLEWIRSHVEGDDTEGIEVELGWYWQANQIGMRVRMGLNDGVPASPTMRELLADQRFLVVEYVPPTQSGTEAIVFIPRENPND